MQAHLNVVRPPSMRFRKLRHQQQVSRYSPERRFAHVKLFSSISTSSYPKAAHPEARIAALPTTVSLLFPCDAGQAVTRAATRGLVGCGALKRSGSALSSFRQIEGFRPT